MEIQVGKNEVAEKTRELLSKLKVADLTIEDPPIEDIIRQVFSKGV